MTTIVPVTQAQITETQINYSTKIGKQVMKAELSKRIAMALGVKVLAEDAKDKEWKSLRQDVYIELRGKVELSIKNDGDITRLRNLYNKFSSLPSHDQAGNNWQAHKDDNCRGVAYGLLDNQNKREEARAAGCVEINVELRFGDYDTFNDRHGEWEPLGYSEEIAISQDIRDRLFAYTGLCSEYVDADIAYERAKRELDNIDATVEAMEAKLLINELQASAKGQEVLNVTTDMVQEMLGDVPPMFAGLEDK